MATRKSYGLWGGEAEAYGPVRLRLEVTDYWGKARVEEHQFYVVEELEPGTDMILGMPWLYTVNPLVDWREKTVNHRMERGKPTALAPIYGDHIGLWVNMVRRAKPKTQSVAKKEETMGSRYEAGSPLDAHLEGIPIGYHDFSDVFDTEKAATLPPHDTEWEHQIDLEEGTTPPYSPIYPHSEGELKVLREYLVTNLERNWIRPSRSSAGAGILFVPKKGGGKPRLCVDYRGLNRITKKNRTALPLMREILDRLTAAKVFTKLDLKDAYHRVRIREGDEWKTAFRTKYGHFEYQVMPFGLANAPATFHAYISNALAGLIDLICILYMDDILIYSKDPADHQAHVRRVLGRLRAHGLYANPEKCEFSVNTVGFLGHVISPQGVTMERARVEAVADWPAPTTIKEIQKFLGFTGFYRRFIQGYSKATAPLTNLLKGGRKGRITLSAGELAAFEELKRLFQEAPLLRHFDPTLPIRLQTDASKFAVGAVLSQLHDTGWHPVAYLSMKLAGAQLQYSTPDAELLAIVVAFRKWRHYLAYTRYTIEVLTDHLNHSYLPSKAQLSGRQARSLHELAPYDFVIRYRAGTRNPADGLSRRPDLQDDEEVRSGRQGMLPDFLKRFTEAAVNPPRHAVGTAGPLRVAVVRRKRGARVPYGVAPVEQEGREPSVSTTVDNSLPTLEEALLEAQRGDAFVVQEEWKKRPRRSGQASASDRWTIGSDQLLRYKGSVYVPRWSVPLQRELIEMFHDWPTAGHPGVAKCYKRLAQSYYWDSMLRDVRNYIQKCHSCQVNKPRHHLPYGLLVPLPVPDKPFQEISMDFITDLPLSQDIHGINRDAVLVVVDRLTKFSYFIPTTKDLTAEQLATLLVSNVFLPFCRTPEGIVSDRGSLFTSKFWAAMMHHLGTTRRLSTAWHPQTDGQTERLNQSLEHYLRAYGNYAQSDWATLLPMAASVYNASYHSAIKCSPIKALAGYNAVLPGDLPPSKSTTAPQAPLAAKRVATLVSTRELIKERLIRAQEYYRKYYNRGRKDISFHEGDWVLLSSKHLNLAQPSRKLAARYIGPFKVTQRIGEKGTAYRLDLPARFGIHNAFHVSSLEPYHEATPAALVPPEDMPLRNDDIYTVEAILDQEDRKDDRYYLIKWKGYSTSENSWEPRSHILDSSLIREYERHL